MCIYVYCGATSSTFLYLTVCLKKGGSASELFDNVRNKLFSLPDECVVYPAHDYKGRSESSIAEEKLHNPRLKLENTKEKYLEIMGNLKLDLPKKIDASLPANLRDGANA